MRDYCVMRDIEKLEEGNYYHIYNRGINGENLFKFPIDYRRFIDRFHEYNREVMETLSFSLLKNHFHFLVYTKRDVIVPKKDGSGFIKLIPSKQLGHFFNAYAQAYNALHLRKGSLFDKPFKRKLVDPSDYLTAVILYIHNNPAHHGFVKDLREWPYSSYHDLIGDSETFLNREFVLSWFGGRAGFIEAHSNILSLKGDEEWAIEQGD